MSTRDRFWRALESVPGLCAVPAEWRNLLGDEYAAASAFLRADGRLASGFPCPAPLACGCVHEVVHHGADDIVAVCRCEPRECDPTPLKRGDIALHEADRRELGAALATAIGAVPAHVVVPSLPLTWSVGTCTPYAGFRFPIYMTVQLGPDAYRHVVDALVARAVDPFLLLVPTRDMLGPDCDSSLRHRKARVLALADEFVLATDGSVRPRRPIAEILGPFLADVLPAPKPGSAMAFFPTPPDATWPAVQIKFKDGYTVSVRVGDAQGVFNYTQMGMANAKNGDATKQWKLLLDFADRHGALDWSSSHAHPRNQKRKETLATNLRAFFRIEGDPFEITESLRGEGKGWRTRFALEPQP